jgi:hypothetical protein
MLRLLLAVAAIAAEVAAYMQEHRRLSVVLRLSGREGRDYLERTQKRGARLMLVLTVLLALGAGAACVVAARMGRPAR